MYEIENVLRPYAWGSTTAIAGLLGRQASGGPEAELWVGAHPDSPSVATAADGGPLALDELISSDPEHHLGSACVAEFGPRLPFLLKVLAAESPLSLQVHPTLDQARTGFAREEAAGVDRSAAERNYKDDNHKPEMIFALTPFEALCGFRPAASSRALFEHLTASMREMSAEVPQVFLEVVADLSAPVEHDALKAAFTRLIGGGHAVSHAVRELVAALKAGLPMTPYQTELSTAVSLHGHYPGDPGVLISLLLNRISLAPGEAVYLPAGNIHAYLHGLGIEVMASSDNVLRGGLTPKFVDVPELLATVEFESVGVPMLDAEVSALGQELYRPPFREFQLQRIVLEPDGAAVPLAQSGAAVIMVVSGSVLLDSPKGDLHLDRGTSAFLPASEAPVNVHPVASATGRAVAFAVTTAVGS
ncbi:mannose-6-phosphate isomerase, class I [Arthrobacter sp. ISL-69]|uniref:mannose-6-phosphate isomerase, class I n=1 Tax=Arthrobacter sp. ISL-69 TaxID=2819113 RepID=UPI001BEA7BF9|nr:mannose-6-phosphate isomerase, class I [Arthrobacter sp. ISL-69]MBT2538066.1 mannose-6-phosphate isomerase, class I [Arthrobacter sp. ISL-69]